MMLLVTVHVFEPIPIVIACAPMKSLKIYKEDLEVWNLSDQQVLINMLYLIVIYIIRTHTHGE
jgi:hypothetical protein